MWNILISLVSIIIVNLVLSGDNALVIALTSRKLPEAQRRQAMVWGTVVAIIVRIALTVVAVYLLQIPFLKAVGGLFLLYVAVKLLVDESGHGEDTSHVKQGTTLGQALWTIAIADLVLSIDNIFAVAAAGNGHLVLVLIGLVTSIPIIVWGASLIMKLVTRFPLLIYIGAAILGWTAGQMITEDKMTPDFISDGFLQWLIPLLTTLLVLGIGKCLQTRTRHRRQVGRTSQNPSA